MRTEEEVKNKILEIKENFLEGDEPIYNLRDMKRSIKILNWVLGKDWSNNKMPSIHGARLEYQ